jgi:hypothetical protein
LVRPVHFVDEMDSLCGDEGVDDGPGDGYALAVGYGFSNGRAAGVGYGETSDVGVATSGAGESTVSVASRCEGESDSLCRVKTEFLVRMDGI